MFFLLLTIFTLLGLFIGSFLNVCIDRLPLGESIISPPSRCPACGQKLRVFDLVPVFSYLFLRGKCRYCGARIPARVPLVEALTAVLFGLMYWKFGLGLELVMLLVYTGFLIVIFFIDQENQLVLDMVTYPGMAIALVFSYFWPNTHAFSLYWPGLSVVSALMGGAFGLIVMALIVIISRGGMGWGDVKMAGLMGLMLGFPLIGEALLIGWIVGGIAAAILLGLKLKGSRDKIPSATFLAIATIVALVWGPTIFQWWLPSVIIK